MGVPVHAQRRPGAVAGTLRALLVGLALLPGPAHAEDELTLRYRLREGDRSAYARTAVVTGAFRLRAGGSPEAPRETTLQVRAEIRGLTTQEVKAALPDGAYLIVENHRLFVNVNGRPVPVPAIGPVETRLSSLGVREGSLTGTLADLAPFGLGLPDLLPGAVLQFPPDPVRVGARWHTRAEWMLPGRQDAVTSATSRFLAVREHGGRQCAFIATQVTIPPLHLRAETGEGDGHLKIHGTATGEAFHALLSGEPLYSRTRLRLSVEVEGIANGGAPAATGSGELEVLIECRQVPPDTQALPALPTERTQTAPPSPPKLGGKGGPPRTGTAPPSPQELGGKGGPPPSTAAAGDLRIRRPAPRERVQGELILDCRVSLPEARYALIRIDGAACAAINAPYLHRVDVGSLAVGEHVLEVVVYGAEGTVLAQGRQVFVIPRAP